MKKIKPKLPFDFSKEATISLDEIAEIFQRYLLLNETSKVLLKSPKKQVWNPNWFIKNIKKVRGKRKKA